MSVYRYEITSKSVFTSETVEILKENIKWQIVNNTFNCPFWNRMTSFSILTGSLCGLRSTHSLMIGAPWYMTNKHCLVLIIIKIILCPLKKQISALYNIFPAIITFCFYASQYIMEFFQWEIGPSFTVLKVKNMIIILIAGICIFSQVAKMLTLLCWLL